MDKPWKRAERRVAQLLGGRRNPVGNEGKPDVESQWLSVEVKYRARLPQWWTDALTLARRRAKTSQLGILVLRERGKPGGLVIMTLSDFKEWFNGQAQNPHL